MRRRMMGFAAGCGLACAAVGAQSATAATSVSSTYAQVGARTVSVYSIVHDRPAGAKIVVETKRFSKGRKGRARTVRRSVGRSGRVVVKVSAPRNARKLTARVRVVRIKKRRGRAAKTITRALGTWQTITFTKGKVARIAPVTTRELVSIVPPVAGTGAAHLVGTAAKRTKVNDVIALGISDKTPEGVLARVTAVSPNPAGGLNAVLEQAALSDVVPSGQLDINIPAEQVSTGRAVAKAAKAPRLLDCTNGRKAAVSAAAEVSAGIAISAGWSGGKLFPPKAPHLKATATGKIAARLEGDVSLDGQAECSLVPQNLFPAPVRLAAFTVVVGPVPVPIVIDGQVSITGHAKASGSMATGFKVHTSAEAGITYEHGKVSRQNSFTPPTFDYAPPAVNGSGEAQVAVAPVVGVRLAGIAGPQFDVSGGLKVVGKLNPEPGEPWWKLTAPLSVGAKFSLQIWRVSVDTDRFVLWQNEPVIAQSPAGERPSGSAVFDQGASPDPLPQGVKTRLTWDSNTDVDLHTWNQNGSHAYFRALRSIPGAYLDQDVIPGYGPETFYETDPSVGNEYTFGVCQFSGENATVTVDVRDADGQTRRFAVLLRGRKAAALLTTSPPGGDPYIDSDADWCSDGGDPTTLGQTTTGTFGTN